MAHSGQRAGGLFEGSSESLIPAVHLPQPPGSTARLSLAPSGRRGGLSVHSLGWDRSKLSKHGSGNGNAPFCRKPLSPKRPTHFLVCFVVQREGAQAV